MKLGDTEFAVTDVETTGFCPQAHDRIIEIAVVRVDVQGNVLDEFTSLVNPNRDIGPTHVHGITAADVRQAPSFEEIAGDILCLLSNAVLVAHNVSFDRRFIEHEFQRIGCELSSLPHLCTMRLAKRADPYISSRRLDRLCEHFSIYHDHAHTAHSDALAAARLMAVCLEKLGVCSESELGSIGVKRALSDYSAWPILPRLNKRLTRRAAAQTAGTKPSYIAQLVSKLPASYQTSGKTTEYLHVLDMVLEDRRITKEEGDYLFGIAVQNGLSRSAAIRTHENYMLDLCELAWDDGVVTDSEQRDLEDVRQLLQISSATYLALFEQAKEKRFGGHLLKHQETQAERIDGKTVCFTGSMRCKVKGQLATRQLAERCAREKGMLLKNTCTKKLDMLVVADPDSMSAKAQKARKYGVRIIAEPVFWHMMGVDVE